MNKHFEGLYFKHQKGEAFLALIPGCSADGAFVQLVTKDRAHFVKFPREAYFKDRRSGEIRVGECVFSRRGVFLDINRPEVCAHAELTYDGLSPLSSDIMGPFRFFPMECRHKVVSMRHAVFGRAEIGGETLDFDGGFGYIEGDSGRSFPSAYTWLQCNDLDGGTSVMASVAKIPFAGFKFTGCICAVLDAGREYRLATYRGVKVLRSTSRGLTLRQGKYLFEADVMPAEGRALLSPVRGSMQRIIKESPACAVRLRFSRAGELIFDKTSARASFEFAD